MVARLMDLYARPGMTVRDVTYGKGVFWKQTDVSHYDFFGTDLALDGTDCRALPDAEESVDVLVFDPPYRYVERKTDSRPQMEIPYRVAASLRNANRPGVDGVLDLYEQGISEASRVLRHGGFAFIKCQDTVSDGRQRWVHIDVMNFCRLAQLEPVDLAIVTTDNPPPTRWKIQRSLKKAHSYFVIARKGGAYPFGYKSVQVR